MTQYTTFFAGIGTSVVLILILLQISLLTLCYIEWKHCICIVPPNRSILQTMACGTAAAKVELALAVVSVSNLAVSSDLQAPQQEVCV